MAYLIQVIVLLVRLLLGALQLAFLLRAILSFLMPAGDNALIRFLYTVTEPVIIPFRNLLGRFAFVRNCPFDISYTVAFFALIIIETVLPTVYL